MFDRGVMRGVFGVDQKNKEREREGPRAQNTVLSNASTATPPFNLLHDALHARREAVELLLLQRLLDRVHGLRHDLLHLADQVVGDLDDELLLFLCVRTSFEARRAKRFIITKGQT